MQEFLWFLITPEIQEFLHPLVLGRCQQCGLNQLVKPASSEEVKPRFDWIRYNEPEKHLDQLASILTHLPGITPKSTFCRISNTEASLLTRLNQKGFSYTWQLSLKENL